MVFLLPTDLMTAKLPAAAEVFEKEDAYPLFASEYLIRLTPENMKDPKALLLNNRMTARDNYTDALMLLNATYSGEEPLVERALMVYRYMPPKYSTPVLDIVNYYGKNTGLDEAVRGEYARYWHGYLVLLKPLLCVMDYRFIRILNMAVLSVLLVWLIYLLNQRLGDKVRNAFLVALLFFMPFTIPFCMQFCTATYVMLIGMLALLKNESVWCQGMKIATYFLLLGICTSYVDYLTYPLVTFGIPMLLYLLLNPECKFRIYLRCGVFWGMGYLGMWAMKWVYTSLILQENHFAEAINQILFRMSNQNEDKNASIGFLSPVAANLSNYVNIVYLLLIAIILVYIIMALRKNSCAQVISEGRLALLTACLPAIWYCVIANHSYVHSSFTYRALFVSVWAILLVCSGAYLKKEN